MTHLDMQNLLAFLLILGMVWNIASKLIKSGELLTDLETRVRALEEWRDSRDSQL